MVRLAVAQILRRPARSMAVVAAIVVAAVAFSLLTSAVAQSRLEVEGTVQSNYRAAYDILVRPAGSRTDLELSDQLVRQNFLSDVFGGISMRQYRRIKAMPGVQVAAPVAMIGYTLPSLYLPVKANDLVDGDEQQLFRIEMSAVTDRGLSRYPPDRLYAYLTGQPFAKDRRQLDPVTGRMVDVCARFADHAPTATSAFDRRDVGMTCQSSATPVRYETGVGMRKGDVGIWIRYPYPLLLAAIDPAAEAALVDLDDTVVDGRYLRSSDTTRTRAAAPGDPDSLRYRQVPVMMADRTVIDERLAVRIQRLALDDQDAVPGRLARSGAIRWLAGLPAEATQSYSMDAGDLYPRLLDEFRAQDVNQQSAQYWDTGPVTYTRDEDTGRLEPGVRRNPRTTWIEPLFGSGFYAPQASGDVGFRKLTEHAASNEIIGETLAAPTMRAIGTYDPTAIRGFSRLAKVPLTTYAPPSAVPADGEAERLLEGRPLLPNNNLAGYLQQPPLLLTNLRSITEFTDTSAYTNVTTAQAPISVIRIRAAGVTGPDETSLERVRVLAERITRETGLDVDITIGSSPRQQLIELPAGNAGRPALSLSEGWSRKGVTIDLLSAIDRKSLSLFLLVLVVCGLSLLNATTAAVRSRRRELGVLSCLGWPARHIFGLLQLELAVIGALAGLGGTALAYLLIHLLDLTVDTWRIALITPVAVAMSVTAGLLPAWRACRVAPVEATRALVRPPGRAHRIGSITQMAVANTTRTPGRMLLGTASLFVGVAALAVLFAIQQAFHGDVVGTSLGEAVAIQVRGVDLFAAVLTIALGAFAVADVAYLNITDRIGEIGTLRSSGWAERHLRQLFATEGAIIAAIGTLTGAILGITMVAILLPLDWANALRAGAAATGIGLAAAAIALCAPISRLDRYAPAQAITTE
ncbi:ABC transporter permease [Nocardioides hungaricus]